MVLPSARQASDCFCISCKDRMICMMKNSRESELKTFLLTGEIAALHIFPIFFHRLRNRFVKSSVMSHELRFNLLIHAQKIVDHQNLTVAIGAGTDTDRGDLDASCDFLGPSGREHPPDQ